MADAPEIPEAKDGFEKSVAISIAIIAVCLSFVGNYGDNAKTDAILKTNETANKWSHFQSKSIKETVNRSEKETLELLGAATPLAAARAKALGGEIERYEAEKTKLSDAAKALQTESEHSLAINDRCDFGSLLLQVAIVVCSVSILTAWRILWFAGLAVGLAGAAVGVSALLL